SVRFLARFSGLLICLMALGPSFRRQFVRYYSLGVARLRDGDAARVRFPVMSCMARNDRNGSKAATSRARTKGGGRPPRGRWYRRRGLASLPTKPPSLVELGNPDGIAST